MTLLTRFRSTARRALLRETASPSLGWFLLFCLLGATKCRTRHRAGTRESRRISAVQTSLLLFPSRPLPEEPAAASPLYRKAAPPFRPPPLQYGASAAGAHAGAEPVATLPLDVTGLV